MKHPIALALLSAGSLFSAASAPAATLESYFDFTKYEATSVGASITSNVHGGTVATVRTALVPSASGLSISPDLGANRTGVVLSPEALRSLTGDFTLQIWYRTSGQVGPNTLLYGGTTSEIGDDSLAGDQALFVGYDNQRGRTRFVRPITNNGSRWGTHLAQTPAGTGTAPDTLYDYVLAYDSGARSFTAYLDGAVVGTMKADQFGGLPALTGGFAIGGVQNSAFTADKTASVGILSFLIYRGALGADEVAKIHAFGADVTTAEVASTGVSLAEGPVSASAPKASVPVSPPAPTPSAEAPAPLDPFVAEPEASRPERPGLRRHRR